MAGDWMDAVKLPSGASEAATGAVIMVAFRYLVPFLNLEVNTKGALQAATARADKAEERLYEQMSLAEDGATVAAVAAVELKKRSRPRRRTVPDAQ